MLFTQTKWRYVLVLLLAVSVLLALPLSAAYPKHSDYISDENGVLSANTVSALKDTNTRLQTSRGVVIAVCITDSLGNEAMNDYARSLFTQWKIANGVLIVVDTAAKDYYAVQCTDIDNVLTNEKLSEILNGYLETEFSEGNIDRGIYKTILKLDEFLTAGLPALNNGNVAEIGNAEDETQETQEEKETSGFVKVLKVVFTILLVLVILAVVLVCGLFVAALFNDTAMDIFQTYIMGVLLGRDVTTSKRNTYAYEEDPYYDAPRKSAKNNRRAYDEYEDYSAPRQPARRQQPSYDNYTERRAPRQTPAQNDYNHYNRQNYSGVNSGRQNYNNRNYNSQPSGRQQNTRNSGESQYRVRNNPRNQYYDDYR